MPYFPFFRYLLLRLFRPNSTRTMEWHMLRLLNRDRKKEGLQALVMQHDLRNVARNHSRDMAQKDYFAHENLEGKSPSDRLKHARVTEAVSGENLAKIGGFTFPTVRAETGLMNSPGHRANILNAHYNCVGIGVIKSERGVYYFTQNFAFRSLLFDVPIRRVVRLKKGLNLKGIVFHPRQKFFLQIQALKGAVKVMSIPIQKNSFDFHVDFPHPDSYVLEIYLVQGKKMTLLNRFELQVKKGWW